MNKIETDYESLVKPLIDKILKNRDSIIAAKYYANADDYAVLVCTSREKKYAWIGLNKINWGGAIDGVFESKKDAVIHAIKCNWPVFLLSGEETFKPIIDLLHKGDE